MVNYSQSESTISRGRDSAASKDAGQLDLRDRRYSSYCTKRPVLPRQIADKHWTPPKDFLFSFTRPKIGSRS